MYLRVKFARPSKRSPDRHVNKLIVVGGVQTGNEIGVIVRQGGRDKRFEVFDCAEVGMYEPCEYGKNMITTNTNKSCERVLGAISICK